MICFPRILKDVEVSALIDYWSFSYSSSYYFKYTLKEIDTYYGSEKPKATNTIVQGSYFNLNDQRFKCRDCQSLVPVRNRKEFLKRMDSNNPVICSNCEHLRMTVAIQDYNRSTIEYKNELFVEADYLDNLGFVENLALISILNKRLLEDNFLFSSPKDFFITGSEVFDHQILYSLQNKGAIKYIDKIPKKIIDAHNEVNKNLGKPTISYQQQILNPPAYMENIRTGIYLVKPVLRSQFNHNNLISTIYGNLVNRILTVKDIHECTNMVTEIQVYKLYQICRFVSKKFRIPIKYSNSLHSMLLYLSNHYHPEQLFYAFKYKGKDVAAKIHTEISPQYLASNFFTSFLSNYIKFIERNGHALDREHILPENIIRSPVESILCQIYLRDAFDLDKLSTNDAIAKLIDISKVSDEFDIES